MLTTPSQPMRSRSSNPFLFINGLISVGWAKYELVNPTRAFKGMPVADGRHTPVSKSSFSPRKPLGFILRRPAQRSISGNEGREYQSIPPEDSVGFLHSPVPTVHVEEMIQWPHQQHNIKTTISEPMEVNCVSTRTLGQAHTCFLGLLLSELKAPLGEVQESDSMSKFRNGDRISARTSADVQHFCWQMWEIVLECSQRNGEFGHVTVKSIPLILSVLIIELLNLVQALKSGLLAE